MPVISPLESPDEDNADGGSPVTGENEQAPSPLLAVFLAFVGGVLAVTSIRVEHFALDFAAALCFLAAWRTTLAFGTDGRSEHPMAQRSTQTLLMAFAVLVALIGTLRLVRG